MSLIYLYECVICFNRIFLLHPNPTITIHRTSLFWKDFPNIRWKDVNTNRMETFSLTYQYHVSEIILINYTSSDIYKTWIYVSNTLPGITSNVLFARTYYTENVYLIQYRKSIFILFFSIYLFEYEYNIFSGTIWQRKRVLIMLICVWVIKWW